MLYCVRMDQEAAGKRGRRTGREGEEERRKMERGVREGKGRGGGGG